MANLTKTQPEWFSLSHHDRYRKLTIVRRRWRQRLSPEYKDYRGRTVHLDGTWINDVPSFYLSLGEAINGSNGYFGACLDALDDCLCGGFGVLSPLTIRLSHFEEVRNSLDGRAWCRFRAEGFQRACAEGETREFLVDAGYLGDGSPTDIARWTAKYEAALAGELFDCDEFGSYFDAILEVFEKRRAELVPEKEEPS
jgi:RNAse (barnase) inhibitor barstar